MGELLSALILTFSLAFVFMLGYGGDYCAKYGFCNQLANTSTSQMNEINSTASSLTSSISSPINLNPFSGTISFPNPFAVIWDAFKLIASLAIAPVTIINASDLPGVIKLGLSGLFTLLMGFLIVSWFGQRSS